MLVPHAPCAPRPVFAPLLLYLQRVVGRPPINTYPVGRRFGTPWCTCALLALLGPNLSFVLHLFFFAAISFSYPPSLHNAVLALLLLQPTLPDQHRATFCSLLPLLRRLCTMSSFVSPLLTDIKHRTVDDPYAADLHSRWTGQSTPEVLHAAQATLPTLPTQGGSTM